MHSDCRCQGSALRDLSLDLDGATELRAFALTGDVDAPRQFLGRLRKPYDNADLAVGTAKDQRGAVRDCDDLPAQVPTRVRELADGFCERRAALQDRIYAMARRPIEGAIVNAHLLAALDDTLLEFADRPRPHVLYVFSDMMQHSDWYSHLDLDWTEWGFEEFVARREETYPTLEYSPAIDGQRVQIYCVPRRGAGRGNRGRRACTSSSGVRTSPARKSPSGISPRCRRTRRCP